MRSKRSAPPRSSECLYRQSTFITFIRHHFLLYHTYMSTLNGVMELRSRIYCCHGKWHYQKPTTTIYFSNSLGPGTTWFQGLGSTRCTKYYYAMHSFDGETDQSWSTATLRHLASAHPALATGVFPQLLPYPLRCHAQPLTLRRETPSVCSISQPSLIIHHQFPVSYTHHSTSICSLLHCRPGSSYCQSFPTTGVPHLHKNALP